MELGPISPSTFHDTISSNVRDGLESIILYRQLRKPNCRHSTLNSLTSLNGVAISFSVPSPLKSFCLDCPAPATHSGHGAPYPYYETHTSVIISLVVFQVAPHCSIDNGSREVLTIAIDCRTISPGHKISK
jgi:hypothetical protein